MLTLVTRAGPQAGMQFPVDRPSVRIGRGSGNDIVLEDTQVSRQHAEISQQGDQYFVRDLGSTNGTLVNDQRVTQLRPLQPGDQLQVGDTVFGLSFAAAGAPAGAVGAAAPAATDWESQLWADGEAPDEGKQKGLIFALVALAAVLLIAAAVVAYLLLSKPSEPEAVVVATEVPAGEVEVIPTMTLESDAPAATEGSTSGGEAAGAGGEASSGGEEGSGGEAASAEAKATEPKAKKPKATKAPKAPSVALPAGQLEQLPAMVTEILGDVPPDQLPAAIATQIQGLPPDQVQAMIGSLFPGVNQAQLPQVVAASFPDIPLPEIEGLLGMVFPGQQIKIPDMGGPVGGRVALGVKSDEHGSDLYVISAMGGAPTLLKEGASEPDYSPDKSQIIYYSWASDKLGLRIMKADGSEDVEVTTNDADSYPSYAPDGNSISFHNMAQNSVQVIKRCIDCGGFHETDRHEITKGEYPAWSPVGDQIAYRGCLGGGQCGLIVANADGSNPRQITTHANDAAPRWSPNGGQIVFHSDRDGNWEVYVINSDGSWLRRITINPTTDVMPVWSPDGLSIAFRSDRGGQWSVYKTSGIGGAAFKLFDADLGEPWAWGKMDWIQ